MPEPSIQDEFSNRATTVAAAGLSNLLKTNLALCNSTSEWSSIQGRVSYLVPALSYLLIPFHVFSNIFKHVSYLSITVSDICCYMSLFFHTLSFILKMRFILLPHFFLQASRSRSSAAATISATRCSMAAARGSMPPWISITTGSKAMPASSQRSLVRACEHFRLL